MPRNTTSATSLLDTRAPGMGDVLEVKVFWEPDHWNSTRRTVGRSIPQVVNDLRSYMPGWKQYFRLAETPRAFEMFDGWIRRRLRALQLSHWRNAKTIARELRARGVREEFALAAAKHAGSWWRMARHVSLQSGLPNAYFDAIGLPRLAA